MNRRPASRRLRLESLENRLNLSGGLLDTTFDGDGVAETLVGNGNRATAVVAAPDGKVITAGYVYTKSITTNFVVTRYNENGTLDAKFGSGGSVNSVAGRASAVALQSDGKILAAGRSGDDFAVVRYTAAGVLDRAFGKNGVATIDIGARTIDDGRAMVLQPDGKIVVAGTTRTASPNINSVAVVRLNANGSLDTTFGTGGKVVRAASVSYVPQFTPQDRGESVALDPGSNKIAVAATLNGNATVVMRFNPNGTPDTSFDGDGEVIVTSLIKSAAVTIQADHKMVLAGTHDDGSGYSSGWDFGLVRLNADGSPDATFGSGGLTYAPDPADNDISDVALQADGQILVYGYHDTDPMLTRFNAADGSLDTTFGSSGSAIGVGVGPTYCTDMALDSAGRIVFAGGTSGGQVYSIVGRFLATGPAMGSFVANSWTVSAGDTVTLTASGVTALNPGSAVTQVAIYGDSNGDGKLDANDGLIGYATAFGGGIWQFDWSTAGKAAGSYKLFARAKDSLGALSDALSIDLTVI